MRQIKEALKAKKPMRRCGECECLTLAARRCNDTFCNCGTSSEGPGVEYIFKDWDGRVLKKGSIDEGATPTPPADPTREGYTFTGWEPEVGPLNSDTTYVAQYEVNQYTVNITVNDNTMGSVDTAELIVDYGTSVSTNNNVLTIDTVDVTATAETGYEFVSWTDNNGDPLPATITGNITIVATFQIEQS